MQISLRDKLTENPEFLNNYARLIASDPKVKESDVCCIIINDFEESKAFVRKLLDPKYKNQAKVSKQSKITKIKSKIARLRKELTVTEAIYQTMEFTKK